jgi:type II secretory pathway pseudopilin PulG
MPIPWPRDRGGAALLEALVALAVLATVGSAAAWTAAEAMRAVVRVHEEEARVRSAARLLTAASLWSRDDLDRHLGSRAQGPWRMRIDRPRPTLYLVSLADTTTDQVLLHTSLYRRGSDQ